MSLHPSKQINVTVDSRVAAKMQAMAATAGVSLTAYATLLLGAAYAARCGETGDIALDTAVARVALLFGTGFDADSIRAATGLSETFVERAITAWQAEMRRAPAPTEARIA